MNGKLKIMALLNSKIYWEKENHQSNEKCKLGLIEFVHDQQ